MASNINPQNPPQQISEVDKSSSGKMNQRNPINAMAEQQKYLLDRYWNYQMQQIMGATEAEVRKPAIPLARIKKIMRADADVKMISAEVPLIFSKACEFFVQELTIKSWPRAEYHGRRTLRKEDIAEALGSEPMCYEFLFDSVGIPREGGDENEMNDGDGDGGLGDEMDVDDGAAN